MKKKLLLVSSLFLVGVTTPLMASCKPTPEPETPEVVPIVEFDASEKDIVVGDTVLLKARVKNPTDTDTVVYSSSKSDVASIDEFGYVKALKSGTTEIRATYGKVAAKCIVNVTRGEYTPTIILKNIHEEEINTTVGSSVDVTAKILFNLKEYDFDPTYTFTEEIGEIADNVFTPDEAGETVLTVSGKFDGVDATPISLKINVTENIVISMKEGSGYEDSAVNLFTKGSYQGETFKQSYTPIFTVYKDGEVVPSPDLNVTCDTKEGLIEFNTSTKVVKVPDTNVRVGETSYEVTYTESNEEYKKSFPIYVNKPVVDYLGDVYDVDKYNSDLDASTVFTDFTNKQLVRVTSEDGLTEYEVDETTHTAKELPSFSTDVERVAPQNLIIYNDIIGFKVTVKVYDKIIRTFEDLKVFNLPEEEPVTSEHKIASTVITGDYYLANDIDGGGEKLPQHGRSMGGGYNQFGEIGFRGVFDGRGHTLKNFKVGEGGIFGNLGKDSVIKNVAITDIDFQTDTGDDTPIISPYINGATIENVYVYGTKIPGRWNNGFVFCNVMSNCKISNCLFTCNVDPSTVKVASYGVLANICGERTSIGSKDVFSNTYIVSKLVATIDTRSAGSEYVVDAPGFYDGDYTSYTYKNLNHDKTVDDMKAKQYDFSSFNEYWEVVDHELKWKGAN